jgi:hypothetical protein
VKFSNPACFNLTAAAIPANPAPTTATDNPAEPVRRFANMDVSPACIDGLAQLSTPATG